MQVPDRHPWRVSYAEAVRIQETLRARFRLVPLRRRVRLVAGTDVAYSRRTHRMYAVVCVVELPSLTLVETAEASMVARFPYVPGLFTFRELPPLIRALQTLHHEPDAVLFDGHGLAHPRRFGLACHGGVLLGRPAVGCAKSRLVGTHGTLGARRGAQTPLRFEGRQVGTVLRTRTGIAPVYVSPGHLVDFASSVELVLACSGRYRIPEPIRLAHRATTDLRRRIDPTLDTVETRTYPDFVRRDETDRSGAT